MLVVTRKQNDRILFPNLGITICVNRLDAKSVRLGIEAPRDVHVVRHELLEEGRYQPRSHAARLADEALDHEARNRLNTALMALQLLQRRLSLGEIPPEAVERALQETISRLEEVDQSHFSRLVEPQSPATPKGAGRLALVVEDNANERQLLAGYLRSCNYEVVTAADGWEALTRLGGDRLPDVVLLDMNMPGLDGPGTVRQIRANPSWNKLKVVAVSGMAPCPIQVGPERIGVDWWFRKPVNPAKLVARIDRELALSS
ncbi:MAG: response regulator [Pirellulaceae bacterium]|nr:response regulator [Pirellulaceae bacterium]